MSALGFLAVSSMLAGGLPAFPRGRRRRLRMPDAMRETAADAKRARMAAKREEDARRSAEGRAPWLFARRMLGVYPTWDWVSAIHTSEMHGHIDADEAAEWLENAEPRWRQRLDYRRSLPWHGWLWLDSHAQWRRLFTPRSFMTKAWRSMKRIRAAAAMRKELSR